jgi:hypothetical protein
VIVGARFHIRCDRFRELLAIASSSIHDRAKVSVLSCYISVVWTLPILASVLGLGGGMLTGHRLRRTPLLQEARRAVDDLLVVVVPTIVRKDTCTALERCAAICAALAMGPQLCSNTSNRSTLLTPTERTPGTGRIAIRHFPAGKHTVSAVGVAWWLASSI